MDSVGKLLHSRHICKLICPGLRWQLIGRRRRWLVDPAGGHTAAVCPSYATKMPATPRGNWASTLELTLFLPLPSYEPGSTTFCI
ncbi:hypothetical protein AFERRI_560040 [Acidithiobacillus ferrivorans]|uniref:Uncharacterized protein n=1 Tax=Acidithiobacillus ferrivorans TaxID=160808 RepID=A0A060UT80_9PROT|nr:hypothetical protein AFERRI_560040 [Acidithiobacillus ferrivorans]